MPQSQPALLSLSNTSASTRKHANVNHDKWLPVVSPFAPVALAEWNMALSSVDCTVPHRNLIPQKGCGYMFPDPGYFAVLDNEKREAAIAAWLSTRPTRCGQMLHPFQGPMPVASSMTWRKFFLDLCNTLARPHGPWWHIAIPSFGQHFRIRPQCQYRRLRHVWPSTCCDHELGNVGGSFS